ncbi:nudix family protein [Nannochloropsis oceanica]
MWRTGLGILMFWARFSKASFIASPYTVDSIKAMASRRTPLGIAHTFSGLGLDRSRVETELKEVAAFESALKTDGAAFALFHGTSALITKERQTKIVYQTGDMLQKLYGISIEQLQPTNKSSRLTTSGNSSSAPYFPCVALGASVSGWAFAVDVSKRSKEDVESKAEAAGEVAVQFEPVRALLAVLTEEDIAVAGLGASILAWHRQHQHCGVCGSPMIAVEGGGRRACTSCRNRAYPRVDPVVIALVTDPARDMVLLGRQRVYRPGMFSCLAGYVSQCESLEEAVRREVKEESGISVGDVMYHSSQPWPIGRGASCQIMVGYIATATSMDISMDTDELEDCRWFSRAEVAGAKELVVSAALDPTGENPGGLSIPGPYAIAHHLIKHWLLTTTPQEASGGRNKL